MLRRPKFSTGLWTPVFAFATPGDSSFTYVTQTGTYTRLGDQVLITMDLNFNSNAYTTAAGVASVSGLPYTAHASLDSAVSLSQVGFVTLAAGRLLARVVANSTMLKFSIMTNNAAAADATVTNFPASKTAIRLVISGSYLLPAP